MPTKTELSALSDYLVRNSIRPNTKRTYSSAQKRFIDFCNQYQCEPFPATEDTLLLYVAYLYDQNLTFSTVQVYLAAVRSIHIMEGFHNPLDGKLRLKQSLRAVRLTRNSFKQKLPITFQILEKMEHLVIQLKDGPILWAAMTLAFFGCLRAGEFTVPSSHGFNPCTHLCVSDVEIFNSSGYLSVSIKRSKTDTNNRGFKVYLGCTSSPVCAYCAVKTIVDNSKLDPTQTPLFRLSSGSVLTKSVFVTQTRLVLSLLGLNGSEYSGHSYRSGSATSAAACGMADWEIKVLGRWSSDAYQRYIRTPSPLLASFSKRLTHSPTFSKLFNFRNPYVINYFN